MTKIKLAIRNRWTGSIIFEYEKEGNTLKDTVAEYIRQATENYTRADLTDADLTRADLTDANLTDADLTRANLTDADLTRANLRTIKNDFFAVLLAAIPEIENLKVAILAGKIDGSTYSGACACLAGTLAKCKIPEIANRIEIMKDSNRPIERFFMGIDPGHTPENNQKLKIVMEWIAEFEGYVFPAPATV